MDGQRSQSRRDILRFEGNSTFQRSLSTVLIWYALDKNISNHQNYLIAGDPVTLNDEVVKCIDDDERDQVAVENSYQEVSVAPNSEDTRFITQETLSLQLSRHEIYQIIDDFLEEDRLIRDCRSNSLSKGESII